MDQRVEATEMGQGGCDHPGIIGFAEAAGDETIAMSLRISPYRPALLDRERPSKDDDLPPTERARRHQSPDSHQ